MMSDNDKFLYKYGAIDEDNIDWARRIFTHNDLYFASPNKFNDPFDCKFDTTLKATVREHKENLRGIAKIKNPDWDSVAIESFVAENMKTLHEDEHKFARDYLAGLNELVSTFGICCMTKVPDNILMWSHYANKHKGFCIKFIHDRKDGFFKHADSIDYKSEFPLVNLAKDDQETIVKKSLYTKATDWKYENEWRVVEINKAGRIAVLPSHLLVGVIFGCKMSDDHKEKIRGWCVNRSVTFYQAWPTGGAYKLEINEFSESNSTALPQHYTCSDKNPPGWIGEPSPS